jgi:hypothetical protein
MLRLLKAGDRLYSCEGGYFALNTVRGKQIKQTSPIKDLAFADGGSFDFPTTSRSEVQA